MGGWDAPWHWVVLAIVVIALIGYKKLPDAARSLGRSLRIFKTEIKGMTEDDKARAKAREEATAEPKALPAAELVKREAPAEQPTPEPAQQPIRQSAQEPAQEPARNRPRPSPGPNGRTQTHAKTD